ncbi:MAG: STAS domain-containing protein [Defluviitaleaceae bacterium]|nr:STAS domain-containing protein [Defluviitaleaceae bacterium]
MSLKFSKVEKDDKITLSVEGRIISSNAMLLENELNEALKFTHIELDMAGVPFITSTVIRTLLLILQEAEDMKKIFRVINPQHPVIRIIGLANLEDLMSPYDYEQARAIGEKNG